MVGATERSEEVDFWRDRYLNFEFGLMYVVQIFEFYDRKGKRVYLSDERWSHIQKHPEMRDKLIFDRIKEAVLHADKVLSDRYDRNVRVHFKHYKDQGQFLLVSVKYLNGDGCIITSFYTDKIR